LVDCKSVLFALTGLGPTKISGERTGGLTYPALSTGAVTAGLSAGIPNVFLDLAGEYGPGKIKYENKSIPSGAKAQFSINFAF
jgi:hypothetical protein